MYVQRELFIYTVWRRKSCYSKCNTTNTLFNHHSDFSVFFPQHQDCCHHRRSPRILDPSIVYCSWCHTKHAQQRTHHQQSISSRIPLHNRDYNFLCPTPSVHNPRSPTPCATPAIVTANSHSQDCGDPKENIIDDQHNLHDLFHL